MTNLKRGLSQMARDIKHIDQTTKTKAKKNKSQPVQKVTKSESPKVKVAQENRPKKSSSPQKRKTPDITNTLVIKKKDIEQHKNKVSPAVINATPKKETAPHVVAKKKPSLLKLNSAVSKSSSKSGKASSNNVSVKRPNPYNEKLSKEKLDQYLSYISSKLNKKIPEDPQTSRAILERTWTFKSPDIFGTIHYYNKPAEPLKKIAPTPFPVLPQKRENQDEPASKPPSRSADPVSKQRVFTSDHNKLKRKTPVKMKPLTPKLNLPVLPRAPSPTKGFVRDPKSTPPSLATKPPSPIITSDPIPVYAHRDSSISRSLGLRETSSKYKRMKYQTTEELLKFYKDRVERAVRDRKTFTVCGNFWSVRRALLARGWVEKINFSYSNSDRDQIKKLMNQNLNELVDGVSDKNQGSVYKRVIMSKMLGKHQVDLFWDYGCDPYRVNPDNVKLTIINNIRRGVCSYSTKEGLCEIMKRSHWYHFPGIANINHPRSYTLTDNGDPDEFIRDFRTTAAMSMLKWIVSTCELSGQGKIISEVGKVPIKNFHFALAECEKFIRQIKHEDIDYPIRQAPEFEWNNFLENYYRCVHIGNHFKSTELESEQTVLHKSRIMLNKLKKFYPFLDMDGYMNIWILKPTAGSRGIGIHICRTLAYVLRVVNERKTIKYVIQKYIERPLLIYNTKFDIRQWFLISSTNPLTIWMYKMCYLRFSSQTYNLRKLHESIHLTNNSVQCKYKNVNRDPSLPDYNMWDSNRFKSYLETIGYPTVYDNVIYPGMKQCVTAAVLIQQEFISTRKNCFELYGADFMLAEDFTPWLIEINSRPALYASTPITGRMCPQVLEDVVKVIVDNVRNPKANTGLFELAYREQQQPLPPIDAAALAVRGSPLPPSYFLSPAASGSPAAAGNALRASTPASSADRIDINCAQHYMAYASRQLKRTLRALLEVIGKERERRRLKAKRRQDGATLTTAARSAASTNTCMPYVLDITAINRDLTEIQEILAPKELCDQALESLAASLAGVSSSSSASSLRRNVVYTETEAPATEEKAEGTGVSAEGTGVSEEEIRVISEHSSRLETAIGLLSKNKSTSKGFLGELANYLGFWRAFAKGKYIVSAPTSPEAFQEED